MIELTYKYRIKDSSSRQALKALASKVNYLWNYINDLCFYDAFWGSTKLFLEYKAKKLGGRFKLVPEAYTTQDCSSCKTRCGPRGLEGLKVREWQCTACGALHDRDVNSAKNILRLGHQTP
jgi:transposase